MDVLRLGSSIPGAYWGCCAVCVIQDFSLDPDTPASIEMVDGDGGNPIVKGGKTQFLGKTNREIFQSRLRIGTFNASDKPNHVFLAVLTAGQLRGGVGLAWLKILKENGFEFIRTTDNSVYTGAGVISTPGQETCSPHENYLFALFRNIGVGAVKNPYVPPEAWTDMEEVVPEAWRTISKGEEFNIYLQEAQLKLWRASSPATRYTEDELVEAGVPITLAGRRSKQPQQLKEARTAVTGTKAVSSTSPFGKAAVAPSTSDYEPVEDVYDLDDYEEEEDAYYDE